MKIFLIESNIHVKKIVQDFTLREPAATTSKIITIPIDVRRLKRELAEVSPNLVILNLDNFRSSLEELDQCISNPSLKYTSFILTSREKDKFSKVSVRANFVEIPSYSSDNREEFSRLEATLKEKLVTFGRIKERLKLDKKREERESIEKSVYKTIGDISKNTVSMGENKDLDRIVPSHSSVIPQKIIVVGSSIGGVEVLEKIIKLLPENRRVVPILITQHIPGNFAINLVERLNKIRPDYNIQIGSNNKVLIHNNVYIAPGDRHMGITRNGNQAVIKIYEDQALVSRHIPSIDVLFRSANNIVGRNALAVILTGMGKDGVKGMGELAASGATTLAQEKSTCVVQGIAGECIVKGFIQKEISIEEIVELMSRY